MKERAKVSNVEKID